MAHPLLVARSAVPVYSMVVSFEKQIRLHPPRFSLHPPFCSVERPPCVVVSTAPRASPPVIRSALAADALYYASLPSLVVGCTSLLRVDVGRPPTRLRGVALAEWLSTPLASAAGARRGRRRDTAANRTPGRVGAESLRNACLRVATSRCRTTAAGRVAKKTGNRRGARPDKAELWPA